MNDQLYLFLIFREATGIPLSIENNIGIIESAYFMSKLSSRIPIVLSILSGNKKVVSQIYTRLYISRIDNDKINDLLNFAVSRFEHSLDLAQKSEKIEDPLNDSIFRIMFDLISRLYVKNTNDNYQKVMNLIEKLFQCNLTYPRYYDKSVSRIIAATPLNILYENKNKFWNIENIILKSNFNVFEVLLNRLNLLTDFKPFEEIPDIYKSKFQKYIEDAKKYDIKDKLNDINKKAYIEYLLSISQIYSLTNEEKLSLKNMLFEKDNIINDLPYTGDYFPFVLDDIIEYDDKYLDIEWNNILDGLKKCSSGYSISINLEKRIQEGKSILEKIQLNKDQIFELASIIKNACEKVITQLSNTNNEVIIEFNENYLMNFGFILAKAIDKSKINVSENTDIKKILLELKRNKIPCAYLKYVLEHEIPFANFNYGSINFDDDFYMESMDTVIALMKEDKVEDVSSLADELVNSINKVDDFQVERILESLNALAHYNVLPEDVFQNLKQKLPFVYEVTNYSKSTDDSIVLKMFVRQALTSLLYTLKENYPNFNIDIKLYLDKNEFAEVRNAWYDRKFINSLNSKQQSDKNEG